MASRQAINVGFPNPNFVSETGSRDAILPGVYQVETAALDAALSETATAADAVDATFLGVGEIVETASATDAPDATATWPAAIAEAASASDAPDASFVGTAAVSEAASASDAP